MIRSFAWTGRKQYYKWIHKFSQSNDDDDDELFLWYGWSKNGISPYFQPEPLSEILTIVNIQHVVSRIWTCTEPELSFVEWSCAVVITTTPQHSERLAVTLCFLASGESQQSLSFVNLIGKSTLSCIIRETFDAIFEALAGEYLHPPSSTEEWENIAHDFQETWNLPHVVGAIDGKHIRIQFPKQSGTFFTIIKDSSVLYCWQFVMLATASHYLMLVSMVAIMILEC